MWDLRAWGLRGWGLRGWAAALLIAVLALVPLYAQLAGTPFHVTLFTRLIILAMAAVSLNLILGYGGMVSFGHAAFIGIGAYAAGIPAHHGITDGWAQLGIAVAASGLFALITGAVSLRTKGVHFIMITLAFSQMMFFAFVSLEAYGGDDGLLIYEPSAFPPFGTLNSATALYYCALGALLASIYIVHRLVGSRFGRVIRGSRANERRMQALGFNTYAYRLACYVIAGVMCGIAGALLGNFTGFVSPDMMSWLRSGELIFMVVLGGSGSLFGPLFGAAAFLLLEETLSSAWVYWQLVFGLILVLVVLYARGGIDGWLELGRRPRGQDGGKAGGEANG